MKNEIRLNGEPRELPSALNIKELLQHFNLPVDRVAPIVRRLPPAKGKASTLAFGRGLEVALEVDEMAFEGGSAHMLGSVLARFFSRYVSINSFTETVLRSQNRGEINRWMPEWGARPTL